MKSETIGVSKDSEALTGEFTGIDYTRGEENGERGPTFGFTEFDDWYSGNDGDEYLAALAGNDAVYGAGGNDTILGMDGHDVLSGGDGDDSLSGGAGYDKLFGGADNDTLSGGTNDDTLDGGDGIDMADYSSDYTVSAGITVNLKTGKATSASGNDTLIAIEDVSGSAFNDTIIGSDAANLLIGNNGHDSMEGYSGNDTLRGGAGSDKLYGGAGMDMLEGGDDSDLLIGDSIIPAGLNGIWNEDTLLGGAGNDTLIGGTGSDFLDGGSGVDLADYSGIVTTDYTSVRVNLAEHYAQLRKYDPLFGTVDLQLQKDSVYNVENVKGTQESDEITGDADDNTFWGLKGYDYLHGGAGKDMLYGAEGNDRIWGDDGDDVIYGGSGNDWLYGGEGNDYIEDKEGLNVEMKGDGGNDTIVAGDHDNEIEGGSGDDSITAGSGNDTISSGSGNDSIAAGSGNNGINISGAGNKTVQVLNGDDYIGGSGLSGNLLISSRAGNDSVNLTLSHQLGAPVVTYYVEAGAGSDTLTLKPYLTSGDIFFDLNAGYYTAHSGGNTIAQGFFYSFEKFTYGSYTQNTNDTIYTGTADDTILSGNGNDHIMAGAGDNSVFLSGSGNKVVQTLGGEDYVQVDSVTGEVSISTGAGDDIIYSYNLTPTALYLDAGEGMDTLDLYFNFSGYDFNFNMISGSYSCLSYYGDILSQGSINSVEVLNYGTEFFSSSHVILDDSANVVNAYSANAAIYGNGGNDTINCEGILSYVSGGDGDDTITLHHQQWMPELNWQDVRSTVSGGAGNDIFKFAANFNEWLDHTIEDFTQGDDAISLTGVVFDNLTISQSGNDTIVEKVITPPPPFGSSYTVWQITLENFTGTLTESDFVFG